MSVAQSETKTESKTEAQTEAKATDQVGRSASLTDRAFTIDGKDLKVPCKAEDVKALGFVEDRSLVIFDTFDDIEANIHVQGIFSDNEDDDSESYYSVTVSMKDNSKPVGRHVVVDGCELGVMTLEEFDKKYPNPDEACSAAPFDTRRTDRDERRRFYLSGSEDLYIEFRFNGSGLLYLIDIKLYR